MSSSPPTPAPAPPQTTDLAPDRLLPQRDELLDAGAVTAKVATLGLVDGPVASATLVRVKYRIGESLRVVWRLTAADGDHLVSARAYAAPSDRFSGPDPAPADRRDPVAPAHRGVADPDWRARWWHFPHDRRLRGADRLVAADPALATQLGLAGWTGSEVAEYAPERSLTVRAVDGDGAPIAFLKAYAPGTVDVDRLAARYELVNQWFARQPDLATPAVLGSGPDLLVLEALGGTPWAADGSAPGAHHLYRLGQAVAHLHDLPVAATTGLSRPFTRLRADRIANSAALVARARPDVATAVADVARRLADRPPAGDIVLLHGDCHPGNALLGAGTIGLIDIDQAGLGEPACDIASLLARVALGALIGEHDRVTAAALSEAFLEGYRQRRELPDPASIRWHLAASLVVERAVRAVNRLHTRGLAQLPAVVGLAGDTLDGGLFTDAQLEANR